MIEPGAYTLQLIAPATGVNFRRAANVQGSVIRALRNGAEVRFYGDTAASSIDAYTWLRVFNGVDGGWIAWMPQFYRLVARENTIWTPGVVMGNPARWHRLRNISGGSETVTTDIHERGFRVVKNSLCQEYRQGEDRFFFTGDSSPFEQNTVYRAVPAAGVPYWPLWWTEGQHFDVRAADLQFLSRATGTPVNIPAPDHRVTFRRFHRTWVNPLGREMANVAEFHLTFMNGVDFETQWYGEGLVGFINHQTGWWSYYDGDLTSSVARPVVSVPAWWPDLIGPRTNQPVEPPVQPEPPVGDEDERRLVWPTFAFDGPPVWQRVEGDRVMVLPAGFSAMWHGWHIDEQASPIPYIFNKGDYYQIKFDWLAGRLYIDIDQTLTWDGPGVYTVMFNISKDGAMVRPDLVQWGLAFDLVDGRQVVIPRWFNAADHGGLVFIPVRIDDPALIERVSLLFHVPEASVREGEMRIYSIAMWPALVGDAERYPADYEMETVGPVQPEPEPPDEPEPPEPPSDDLAVQLREIAERLHGIADELAVAVAE